MNDSSKNKIKAILLSAVAALSHSNVHASDLNNYTTDFKDKDAALNKRVSLWNHIYKNVAKIDPNGNLSYIASHRSHMSHRSGGGGGGGGHISHMSHYSSYGRGSSSHYSSSSSSYRSRSSRSTSSSNYVSKPRKKTPGDYSYGDRTLKSGIYGSDVTTLTGYLATALYLKRTDIKEKAGYSLYDGTIVSAIKHFQKDAGIPQTGIADSNTMDKLRGWDSDNTTVALGTRDLSYLQEGTYKGTDVTELVNLLSKAGFPPDPSKIVMTNGKTEFTKDIEIAVKFFQAYNGLTVSGTADSEVIALLCKMTK